MAMMSIEEVDSGRAKQLGMEVRARAAGPELVRVELEFDATGTLKNFERVELEMREGGKLLLSATLREERSGAGHIRAGFAADRGSLDQLTLRVVTGMGRTRTGYDLPVKDFVDLAKVR